MKIAIITFSDFNTNYGSILQAFALKCFLQNYGHEVVFIRYREYNKIHYNTFKDYLKKQLINLYYLLHTSRISNRRQNFIKFIDAEIPHTRLYTSEEDIEQNLTLDFDAYICGSDQIWNIPVLGGLRRPYFLQFAPVHKLKIAYAPSMGEFLPQEPISEEIFNLLHSFDFISTREQQSSFYLSNALKMNIPTVVDPTLLLDGEEWLQYLGKTHIPQNEYGVCYFVRRSVSGARLVRQLKQKFKVPIYNVSDNLINIPGTSNKYASCGPRDFVNLIAGAKFCVGTSFHLAAFSTIFNKHCFIASSNHNRGRITTLFSYINRVDHCINVEKGGYTDILSLDDSISYEELNKCIEKSKQQLLDALNNGK